MPEKLFNVLAGKSADYFELGGVSFEAAPFTLLEYVEYTALPEGDLGARAEFLAEKMRRRVRGNKTDPALITDEWILENMPLPTLNVVQTLFMTGEMPKGTVTPGKD